MSYRLIRESMVKTRKPHRCEWCAERIETGETVPYRAYHFDGELQQGWMHSECKAAMLTVDIYDLMDGWTPGDYSRGAAE
jgi:hypothetical protein